MNKILQKLSNIVDIKTNKKESARLLRKLCFNINESDFEIIEMHILNVLNDALKIGYSLNNEYHEFREKNIWIF